MQRLTMVLKAALLPLALCAVIAWAADVRPSVPYVPTPQAVVDKMLAMGASSAGSWKSELMAPSALSAPAIMK